MDNTWRESVETSERSRIRWLSNKNQGFLNLSKISPEVLILAKFPEAEARKFRNRYVCRRCKSVMKAPPRKVLDGKIKCRKCDGRAFKPKRKK